MTSASNYIQRLLEADALRRPILRDVIQSLQLAPDSRGLDAGCGIGLQAMQLAESVGPAGHVTGFDILPELLAYGKEQARQAGYGSRITFEQGDLSRLPYEDHSFDWLWSADCVGYPVGDLATQLKELVRVIKPGGRIFLLAWTSQQLLPGYPLLEANLNATCSSYLPYVRGKPPKQHFLRAIHSFQQAGLCDIQARTFVSDLQAPLNAAQRAALLSLFDMLWGQPQPETAPDDWQAYQQLCRPQSAGCILDIPGYYAFFTYTLFSGRV